MLEAIPVDKMGIGYAPSERVQAIATGASAEEKLRSSVPATSLSLADPALGHLRATS